MDDHNFTKEIADQWIQLIESQSAKIRETDIYPTLLSWLEETEVHQVLDYGCGQGAAFSYIDIFKNSYTGIDPSQHLIQRAQHLHPKNANRFHIANGYQLPFQKSSFSHVFSIAVFHLL